MPLLPSSGRQCDGPWSGMERGRGPSAGPWRVPRRRPASSGMTVGHDSRSDPRLGFSLPEASPLSADGFPHDAPAGGCSLLFPVLPAFAFILCSRVQSSHDSGEQTRFSSSTAVWGPCRAWGWGGEGGPGPALVLTGRPCGEGIGASAPLHPRPVVAHGGAWAAAPPPCTVLSGSSPQGRVICLQGSLGRRLGKALPAGSSGSPGERGHVRPCPLKSWAILDLQTCSTRGSTAAKRLLLQELSAEALDLACPLT